MINLQDFIENTKSFRKFAVDDLLFVEYKCPLTESTSSVWWHNNFFAFVLAGETLFKTPYGEYIVKTGDCVFAKKGSVIVHSHLEEEYCELAIFVPDDFIKLVIDKYKIAVDPDIAQSNCNTIIPLVVDDVLLTYFHSLLPYFLQAAPPPGMLLKLKFEELILNILASNNHIALKCYFSQLNTSSKPSIKEIMEANFFSNLSIREFAKLCARSLSAFKLEFKDIYHTTPGRWLQEKRLEYSRYLLETTANNVDEVCEESGFENSSHFIRAFKNKYGLPPGKFRTQGNFHKIKV